jgi:hypothetical protein
MLMEASTFTDWAGLVLTLGALLVAVGGFVYAGRQLLFSQRSARGAFLLDLEDVLRHHDCGRGVHGRLRADPAPH